MKRTVRTESLLWTQWEETLHKRRNRIAVIAAESGASWTFQRLHDTALCWSDRLASFAPGQRIAFRLRNGPAWLALFLGMQRRGLTAVPLDGGLPDEGCCETAWRLEAQALYMSNVWHSLHWKKKEPLAHPGVACLKLTSGSDAHPKEVACRAEHLLADGRQIITSMRLRPADVNLAAIPLGHSYGLGNLVLPLILQGTAMVCAVSHLPRQLLDWIERYKVTVFPAVPALLRVLAALPPGTNMDSMRTVISAAAILPPAVAQAFHQRYGLKVHNFYGSSETGGICYDRTGSASLQGRSVGKPLDGVSVTVKAGRITVRSPAVATRGHHWRVPDTGEWNSRDELVLHGRIGQLANIGGRKVHPLEVEQLLRTLPGVTDASVWLRTAHDHDILAAAVETSWSRPEIEKALACHLPAWKLPRYYIVAAELPRNPRGKLDLAVLRKM